MRFSPLGDHAVMITLGDTIDEPTHPAGAHAVTAALDANRPPAVVDLVAAFASVAVHYDPAQVAPNPANPGDSPYHAMVRILERALSDSRDRPLPPPRVVEIPVCYGGDFGPDLEEVAARHGLRPDQVVEIHASGDYLVYMVGFMPGFAYLGGLPERIETPRRASPRRAVPAGTVGIGGEQTGVYPLESPGGWNLIGRTPLKVFDIIRAEPILMATGDRVRFRAISTVPISAPGLGTA